MIRRWVAPVIAAAAIGALTATVVVHGQSDPPSAVLTDGAYDCDFQADGFICTAEVPPSTTVPATSTSSSTTTSTPPTTAVPTTVAPTSTVAPSTTVAPSSTTSAPPSSTSSTTSTSTSTTPPAPSTTVPAGVAFSEDFSNPNALSRFDFGTSGGNGDVHQGDHDMACGDPALTHRTIQPVPSQIVYQCAPGGDPAKAHLMTSVNTTGYVIAWFSPKPVFNNVRKVCWDQNQTALGGGKWTQVLFLIPSEYEGQTDLGFTSPEFPNTDLDDHRPNGPGTPQGSATAGVKLFVDMAIWNHPTPNSLDAEKRFNQFAPNSINHVFNWTRGFQTTDKAARYTQCITDLENGRVQYTDGHGGTYSQTGFIPNGNIRVVFEDDNYDPPKRDGYSPENLTWHFDSIRIETAP